ncbi:hypothetical protein FACS189421_00920 [Bacteroidia bacterium]|nr:hypothetical protein FACS189421_00920 [Bacteroidia bacterium]GHT46207.1 hypothetical protein FACS189440_03750 [Bacteroidia bacterium]
MEISIRDRQVDRVIKRNGLINKPLFIEVQKTKIMEQEIKALKEKFRTAKGKKLEEIDQKMERLVESNPSEFEKKMLSAIRETNNDIEEIVLRNKLEPILPVISVSYLAKQYFDKTPQWFYQRMNGNTVNGKQAKFTGNELATLEYALIDISNKIKQSIAFVS